MNYKRILKYEADGRSTVHVKKGFKGKRKIFVNGFYRQWHLLSNDKKLKEKSNNIHEFKI